MNAVGMPRRGLIWLVFGLAFLGTSAIPLPAQQWVTETRDPKQTQDEDFAKAYAQWTGDPRYGSPLVDHLPRVPGGGDATREDRDDREVR
jgi:hypothetical protein